MYKQRIVIELNTDACPSELLGTALEFGKALVEEHGGEFDDDDGAWVEDAPKPQRIYPLGNRNRAE
tara:strand:- start:943 stop:1140 length:198 start_codon:yes stop_codon:yes gene_type:complete